MMIIALGLALLCVLFFVGSLICSALSPKGVTKIIRYGFITAIICGSLSLLTSIINVFLSVV